LFSLKWLKINLYTGVKEFLATGVWGSGLDFGKTEFK